MTIYRDAAAKAGEPVCFASRRGDGVTHALGQARVSMVEINSRTFPVIPGPTRPASFSLQLTQFLVTKYPNRAGPLVAHARPGDRGSPRRTRPYGFSRGDMRQRLAACRAAPAGARNLAAGRVGAYGPDPVRECLHVQFDHGQVAGDE